jgi:hypothetical protein
MTKIKKTQVFFKDSSLLDKHPEFIFPLLQDIRSQLISKRNAKKRKTLNAIGMGNNVAVRYITSRKKLADVVDCEARTVTNHTRELQESGLLVKKALYDSSCRSRENPLGQRANEYELSSIFLHPAIRKGLSDLLPFLKAPSIRMLLFFTMVAIGQEAIAAKDPIKSQDFQQQFISKEKDQFVIDSQEWNEDSLRELERLGEVPQVTIFEKKVEGGAVQRDALFT